MNVSITGLLSTSQISVEYERNLYSLFPCTNGFMSPQPFKMHFTFFRKLHLHSNQFILYAVMFLTYRFQNFLCLSI